jgi:LmbE family N-acetylglucosaminyl deacetylase
MTELLSVVIPTYERPERLREAALSVLDQDYPHLELIVVDDGPTGPTDRVLDQLAEGDRRVVVVHHDESRGASAARNSGLAVAKGELVAFCDDDDTWLPGAAGAAVSASSPSIGVVYGWHQVLHESTGRCVTFRPPSSPSPALMRWINVPAILSGVIRRDRVGDALIFDTALTTSEDWDLWLRCSDLAPMKLVPTALYRYVQHRGDRVTRDPAGQEQGHRRFLDKHRSSMTAACIAHHELTMALTNRDRHAVLAQIGKTLSNPTRLGAGPLLAGELLASRVGQHRQDPGLPLRMAAKALAGAVPPSRPQAETPDDRARPDGGGARRWGRTTWRASRLPIGALWGWAQVALARNATETLVRGTALVLSPHPDDETIGCGLLLAQMARGGYSAYVAVATDGSGGWYSTKPRPAPAEIVEIRHGEWHRGLDALRVPKAGRFEFGFPDGSLSDHEGEASARIGDLLRRLSPSKVFVTKPHDPNPDHRALARAALRAVIDMYGYSAGPIPGGGRESMPIDHPSGSLPEVYSYRVYPGEGLWPEGAPPRASVARTLRQFARSVLGLLGRRPMILRAASSGREKIAAIEAHESQRKLLDGELRYVWRTHVELYRPMNVPFDPTSSRPDQRKREVT